MLRRLRVTVCGCAAFAAVLGLGSGGMRAGEAESADVLPPEAKDGEWIEDVLEDGSLWFASSENLDFEDLARELGSYPRGRRWVRVVDGNPAWVMYYVPGEILGFEVDTHHFGAAATEFRFAVGNVWTSLTPVDVDFEEIVAFDSKWLRLYRSADKLPKGTRFLQIEFPRDADAGDARLTEVWLRCRFDPEETISPQSSDPVPAESATKPSPVSAAPAESPVETESAIEPYVVTMFVFHPATPPEPEFPPVAVDAVRPIVVLELPPELAKFDVIGELARLLEVQPEPAAAVPMPEKPKPLLSRIVDFVRERVLR